MNTSTNPQSFIICPNLILMRDTKILLLRRTHKNPLFPGYWHCVTGKIEQGETPKQTIIREAFEEVGLKVNPDLKTVISVAAKDFYKKLGYKEMEFNDKGLSNNTVDLGKIL